MLNPGSSAGPIVRAPQLGLFLAYFEKHCPLESTLRGALERTSYNAQWFDPRTGAWSNAGSGTVQANQWGWLRIPALPSADDWGLKLTARSQAP
jgi:hypothetical protein